jgi:hypothetical protein
MDMSTKRLTPDDDQAPAKSSATLSKRNPKPAPIVRNKAGYVVRGPEAYYSLWGTGDRLIRNGKIVA